MNIFQRFIKSISDYKSANIFIKEKMSKSVFFLIIGYFLFAGIFSLFLINLMSPIVENSVSLGEEVLRDMGEFTIKNGGLDGYQGLSQKTYRLDNFEVVLDIPGNLTTETTAMSSLAIQADRVLLGGQVLITYETLQAELTNKDIEILLQELGNFLYIMLFIMVGLGLIGVFLTSGLVWCLMIMINGFLKRDISSSNLYKVAIHAMVVPGIFTLLVWIFNIATSFNVAIYFTIAGFYGYQFIKHYNDNISLENLYE